MNNYHDKHNNSYGYAPNEEQTNFGQPWGQVGQGYAGPSGTASDPGVGLGQQYGQSGQQYGGGQHVRASQSSYTRRGGSYAQRYSGQQHNGYQQQGQANVPPPPQGYGQVRPQGGYNRPYQQYGQQSTYVPPQGHGGNGYTYTSTYTTSYAPPPSGAPLMLAPPPKVMPPPNPGYDAYTQREFGVNDSVPEAKGGYYSKWRKSQYTGTTAVTTQTNRAPAPIVQSRPQNEWLSDDDVYNGDDIRHHKLAYLLGIILFFIPLLAARRGRLSKFYANQGLIFLIIHTVLFAVFMIANFFIGHPFDMLIFGSYMVLLIMVSILMLIAIINVIRDAKRPVPVIGKLVIIKE